MVAARERAGAGSLAYYAGLHGLEIEAQDGQPVAERPERQGEQPHIADHPDQRAGGAVHRGHRAPAQIESDQRLAHGKQNCGKRRTQPNIAP